MLEILRADERGTGQHDWLFTRYSFSFAGYYDPKRMGFSVLRVINEDFIKGEAGFPTHGHKNMEIITYIVDGALMHKDNMGNQSEIRPGEVQRMSAGTGVLHSEINPIKHTTHLLQIWILPEKLAVAPSYEQKSFEEQLKSANLVLVASRDGEQGSLSINQDIKLYASKVKDAGSINLPVAQERRYWLQNIKGDLIINSHDKNLHLAAGDALAIDKTNQMQVTWTQGVEYLFFDLP